MEAAKDAFLYLLAFLTLGTWAIQLGSLLFSVIESAYPNPALDSANVTAASRGMADDLAGIIVAFPVFLVVTWGIVRSVRRQPERLESPVRKWLTNIALVITASTMIGDMATFLAYFLRGDLDTRFILKVVTVLVIAGGILAYYLDSLRRDSVSPVRNRLFAAAALLLVGLGVAVGFAHLGSPTLQRSTSEDARRLFDLSSLAQALHNGWLGRGQGDFIMPATIQDLQNAGLSGGAITDPESRQPYAYAPLGGTAYRLCASFSWPSPYEVPAQWRHTAGFYCFTRNATGNVDLMPRPW